MITFSLRVLAVVMLAFSSVTNAAPPRRRMSAPAALESDSTAIPITNAAAPPRRRMSALAALESDNTPIPFAFCPKIIPLDPVEGQRLALFTSRVTPEIRKLVLKSHTEAETVDEIVGKYRNCDETAKETAVANALYDIVNIYDHYPKDEARPELDKNIKRLQKIMQNKALNYAMKRLSSRRYPRVTSLLVFNVGLDGLPVELWPKDILREGL